MRNFIKRTVVQTGGPPCVLILRRLCDLFWLVNFKYLYLKSSEMSNRWLSALYLTSTWSRKKPISFHKNEENQLRKFCSPEKYLPPPPKFWVWLRPWTCLTHSTDKDQRLTLESWFTNLQPNPLNRSRKLPAAYERLLQSEYRTADENADWLWTIPDNRPLSQSKRHTAEEDTDWLYLIRDWRLLFHKNDYSDEFIDTNYYKQNRMTTLNYTWQKTAFYKAFVSQSINSFSDYDISQSVDWECPSLSPMFSC